ncbi:MAG: hypothetical protein CO093_02895 [Alphaproteobacteria bacterium CG_4_9_14_3_um_filter_47_13]|nr:MAG: hypothetical protein CO093_02895 [Alphaproteobacteria bacterium CG_4_9_14_3_um_filter_47_13]
MPTEAEDFDEDRFIRLSDRILFALEMALVQEDIELATALAKALELAMTRNTGGGEFIERRDYPAAMEAALNKLKEIRKKQESGG